VRARFVFMLLLTIMKIDKGSKEDGARNSFIFA
jgi:hypothetical protein